MRCDAEGWLAGPGEPVADRAWRAGAPPTGCSNLRCGRCGRRVEDLGQRLLTRRPAAAAWLEVHDQGDWDAWTEPGLEGWRTWVCGCRAFPAHQPLAALQALALEDDLAWACDGHPG